MSDAIYIVRISLYAKKKGQPHWAVPCILRLKKREISDTFPR